MLFRIFAYETKTKVMPSKKSVKKKKSPKGHKIIPLAHLPYECCISYNLTYTELVARVGKISETWAVGVDLVKELLDEGGAWATRKFVETDTGGKHLFFILLTKEMSNCDIEDILTVSHEAFHITQFAFKRIRADLLDEKESAAYFHEYVTRETLKFIIETNGK